MLQCGVSYRDTHLLNSLPWHFHFLHPHSHGRPILTSMASIRCSPLPNSQFTIARSQVAPSPADKQLRLDISPYRAFSVVRLLRIEQGGAYADILSGDGPQSWEKEMDYVERTLGFRTIPLESRGQRQVTDTVAGITRWKRYLDFLITSYHDPRSYEKMEPLLRQILRLGVYELVKLEIPPHAAVNETVKLGKVALRTGAGNLVNGILRTVSRNQKSNTLPRPKVEGDDRARARILATLHSHPVWMVRRWVSRYGEKEATKLMEWNNRAPTYALRSNIARDVSRDELFQKLVELEVGCELSSVLQHFVRVSTGMQAVIQAGLIQKGLCAVQDESAGLVVGLVNPQPGETIVDCCAAPGRKALFMASCLKNQGRLVAIDINRGRLHVLEEAAKVLGVESIVQTYHGDVCDFADEGKKMADKVLLDAPCSGLGVLSKRADLRWRRAAEDMEELPNLQGNLLNAAASLVKPGGVLIYSTCSIEPDENEDCVSLFLDQHPEFMLECAESFVPEQFVTKDGFFASIPHKHYMDGAFAARLCRRT